MSSSTPTITFTVGAPGAGKSRWAHQEIARRGLHEVQRVNLDDFLTMTLGRSFGDLSSSDLKLTKRMLINVIRTIAESGRDVIVDNTHLSTRFPDQVRDELGDLYHYVIKDFTVVPLAECIENDAVRHRLDPTGHVGEEEVTRQHARGLSLQQRFGGPGLPGWESQLNLSDGINPYEPDTTLPRAIIVDLDGTLALHTGRGPYDTSRYHTDTLERRLAEITNTLAATHCRVLALTGRYEEHRAVTHSWLVNNGVHFNELHMRADGDARRDNQVKLEMFNKHVRDRFNVIAAWDDRDRVVRLWRRLGLLTNQVAFGDF